MTKAVTLNRKNNGKQFAATDETRYIFHWHRPGEALPKLITHADGRTFLLDQYAVDKAQANGRQRLLKINTKPQTGALVVIDSVPFKESGEPYTGGKGATVQEYRNAKWDTLKDVGSWAGLALAGAAAATLIVDNIKGFL